MEEIGKIFQLQEAHPFLQRPHIKSKGVFSSTLKLQTIQSSYLELLHSTLSNCLKEILQCQYHWHGPPELMNQTHLGFPFQYGGWPVNEQIRQLLIYMLKEWGETLSKEGS